MDDFFYLTDEELDNELDEFCRGNYKFDDPALEMIAETGALLLENPKKIAEILPPEEVKELEQLRARLREHFKDEDEKSLDLYFKNLLKKQNCKTK